MKRRQSPQIPRTPTPAGAQRRPVPAPPAAELSTWDPVDESSWESFPASDPPAWGA